MFKATIVLSLFALTALGWQQQGSGPRLRTFAFPLKEERILLEHNVTLGEAVVRVEAESEEELAEIEVGRPDGERLFALHAMNATERGLSGFEIELREASLETILDAFAEGPYEIRATTADGRAAQGRATLSLDLPPAPRLLYPYEGAVDVPTSKLTVHWRSDRWALGYHVQLEQGENDGLAVHVPAGRNSLQIPDGILAPGMETQLEIAAIGTNGNRTVVEVHFMTRAHFTTR